MKKFISIFIILGVLASTSSNYLKAQGFSNSGVKGGLTYSNLYIDQDDLDTENARLGFHVGFYSQIMFSEMFGIQPEVLFTTKGTEANYTGALNQTVDFKLNYLDVPLLLVFKPVEMFEIYAGPFVGILLNSKVEYSGTIDGETELDRDNLNTLDYGVAAGLAFNFNVLKVGLRYNLGLQDLADSNAANVLLGDSKNSYGQLYIALNLTPRNTIKY